MVNVCTWSQVVKYNTTLYRPVRILSQEAARCARLVWCGCFATLPQSASAYFWGRDEVLIPDVQQIASSRCSVSWDSARENNEKRIERKPRFFIFSDAVSALRPDLLKAWKSLTTNDRFGRVSSSQPYLRLSFSCCIWNPLRKNLLLLNKTLLY